MNQHLEQLVTNPKIGLIVSGGTAVGSAVASASSAVAIAIDPWITILTAAGTVAGIASCLVIMWVNVKKARNDAKNAYRDSILGHLQKSKIELEIEALKEKP